MVEKRISAKLQAGSSKVLIGIPANIEETLNDHLQRRGKLKLEYIAAIEEHQFLSELQKKPEEWLRAKQGEEQLSESADIVKELKIILSNGTNKLLDTTEIASDAVDDLKEKLAVLSQKVAVLEEKYCELTDSDSSEVSIQSLNRKDCEIQCMTEKVIELLSTARAEREILRERIGRMDKTLQDFEEIASANAKEQILRRNELDSLKLKLKEIEHLCGVQCHLRNSLSVDVVFEGNHADVSGDKNLAKCDEWKLTATLIFCENEQGYLELSDVKTDKIVKGAESVFKTAKDDKDLCKLITELKILWSTRVPLLTEISNIRRRHAIDWIQEKGILLLMVKKSNSVVCTLKVPKSYPFSGHIVLENVMGHNSAISPEDIEPPADTSLKGWVQHLEVFFSQ